jgi:phosphoribosylformylglycinamidine (FGAM) synthase PurS component
MLWEVDIYPAEGLPNRLAAQVAGDAADLGLAADLDVTAAYGYLIQGEISGDDVRRIAAGLLADRVVERTVAAPVGDPRLSEPPTPRTPHAPREDARHAERDEYGPCLIHVLPKPGVMDPVAQSVVAAIADFGLRAEAVRTLKKYWVASLSEERLALLCSKILANDAIEQVIVGPLGFAHLEVGSPYEFKLESVPIRGMDDAELQRLSQTGQLFLSLIEMQTIRDYFRKLDRDPTDVELESRRPDLERALQPQDARRPDSLPRRRGGAAV